MLTDSESLLKTLVNSSTTTENRLMADIRAAKKDFERRVITHFGWIRTHFNDAEGISKEASCKALDEVLEKITLDAMIEQWIERAEPT